MTSKTTAYRWVRDVKCHVLSISRIKATPENHVLHELDPPEEDISESELAELNERVRWVESVKGKGLRGDKV